MCEYFVHTSHSGHTASSIYGIGKGVALTKIRPPSAVSPSKGVSLAMTCSYTLKLVQKKLSFWASPK